MKRVNVSQPVTAYKIGNTGALAMPVVAWDAETPRTGAYQAVEGALFAVPGHAPMPFKDLETWATNNRHELTETVYTNGLQLPQRGKEKSRSKTTPEHIEAMERMAKNGAGYVEIASKTGLARSTVKRLLTQNGVTADA